MNKTTNPLTRRLGAAAIALVFAISACGSDDDASDDTTAADSEATASLSIADPWSRQPAEGQSRTAVYGVVTNGGDDAITVVAASSPVTDRVELHETTMNDEGEMSMQEREEGFEIAAGGSFVLEPGGPHVMFFDIDPATYPTTVDVTLEFDNGDTLAFVAEVREIEAMGDMGDMGDMEEGEMEEGEMEEGEMEEGEMEEGEMDG